MDATLAQWLGSTAANVAMEDGPAERAIETTLGQRIAVGLLQARAAECRALAGELRIAGLTGHPIFHKMFEKLHDRSSDLEAMALELCATYPPNVEEPPVVPLRPKLVEVARR